MLYRTALICAIAVSLTSCSQTPDPICQELDATIDRSIQRIALSLADGDALDKGATQQAARYIAANNHFQVIRISLDLQSQHKCQVRKSVINPLMYEREAQACSRARLTSILAATGEKKQAETSVAELCDSKKWKGDAK
jgi:starvation-inducible outer membrane lipoprotein